MNIGKVFKRVREERGITQRAFAAKLGLTPTALWKIEAGRNHPKPATINRFKEVAGYVTARLYLEAFEPEDYCR